MATYWVSVSAADDTGDGLSYNTRKKNFEGATGALSKLTADGDILNVVAEDGNMVWPLSRRDIAKEVTIRGTNQAGSPALATIAPTATGVHYLARTIAGGKVTFQNLIFDSSGATYEADASYYTVAEVNSTTSKGLVFQYCAHIGARSGFISFSQRRLTDVNLSSTVAGAYNLVCSYCYFQNCDYPTGTGYGHRWTFDHCVGIWDTAGRASAWMNQGNWGMPSPTNVAGITHCTFYENTGASGMARFITYQPNAVGDVGTFDLHSNLLWVDSTSATPGVNFIYGGVTASVTNAGTIGYNVLLGGPNISAGDINGTHGWYGVPWDSGADTYATDEVHYGVAAASAFLAPTVPYNWVLPNGLIIPILYDLRPRIYMTAGLAGATPGALPAASTDYSLSVVVDKAVPNIGDSVRYTLTLGNTGNDATGVVVDALLPAGVTYVSHTASTGTYDYETGQWDVATLADGATATLLVVTVVDQDQAGDTITYTVEVTDGDPIPDPDALSDDTDSVSITVVSVSRVPYLDVVPIYAPDLRLEINSSLRAYVNRVRMAYPRFDDENIRWREFATKQFAVATSETVELVTGLENYYYIILQSDEPVDVSVGPSGADRFFPQCTMLMLAPTLAQRIQVRNPGTATATVLITVVDNGNAG